MDTPVPLQFPYTFFKSQKWMDDYGARDMRYGDLSETQLKRDYGLEVVALDIDPYELRKASTFDRPQSVFCGSRPLGEKLTHQQCVAMLFDEFRGQAKLASFQGPYQLLIEQLITHMQRNNGAPFRNMLLDRALEDQIVNDWTANSSRLNLEETIRDAIDWENKIYPEDRKDDLRGAILKGKLPKFDRLQDLINGMSISVHDTWATYITIESLNNFAK